MAIANVVSGVIILGANTSALPGAFALVIEQAFSPTSAQGGFAGATVRQGLIAMLGTWLFVSSQVWLSLYLANGHRVQMVLH